MATEQSWNRSSSARSGVGRPTRARETFEPRGAFYAFPEVTTATGLSDEVFAERLLTEEKVAVIPGSAFGPSGAGHVRMCYATSYERLEEDRKSVV